MSALRRVLLVDADPTVRSLLAEVLECEDFAVLHADGGEAALDSVQTGAPLHAVVLDWELSGVPDAAETLAYIRHRDPFLPVVVYAAFPARGLTTAGKLGATIVLAKESRFASELPGTLAKVIANAEQLSRDHQGRQRKLISLHDQAAARYEDGSVRLEVWGHGDLAQAHLRRAESSRRRADELRRALARERWHWDSEEHELGGNLESAYSRLAGGTLRPVANKFDDGDDSEDDHTAHLAFEDLPDAEESTLSRGALGLHSAGIAFAHMEGHPGFVPDGYLEGFSAEMAMMALDLCKAGLWERVDGGYRVLDTGAVEFLEGIDCEAAAAICAEEGHDPEPGKGAFCLRCAARLRDLT